MNLVVTDDTGVVITLKEITDLIGKRHDKVLIKVEKLAEEPSFGSCPKRTSTMLMAQEHMYH